jgi:putative protease
LDCGVTSVIADFRQSQRYGNAVRAAHLGGASILLAAPRIHKPGESATFEQLAEQKPDGILVRNLAGLAFCRRKGLPAVADFSLNAVNDLSVEWLHAQGARRVTAAYDLSRERLLDLCGPSITCGAGVPPGRSDETIALADGSRLNEAAATAAPQMAAVPPEWLEVVVYRHTPMFHSEYCLFCGTLSSGKDRTDCGRPCQRQELRLRDRLGVEHRLSADSQCRNTLFHGEAESLLEIMPQLQDRGVRHFRVELLAESSVEEVARVLTAYRRLCSKS